MQLIVDKVVGIKDTPYTFIFGLGKSLIACGLLLTVLVDGTDILFAPDSSRFPLGRCVESSILEYSLFCIAGFELGRLIAVLIFLFVVVGLLPAVFSIPFAYAAWSLQATIAVPEGGDQLASNLALILIPISLLDWRLTQWAPRNSGLEFDHKWSFFRNNVRITGVVVLWFQMAVVYFFAAIEKIPVEEWREGTAIYYWATDPSFGATGIRLSVLSFLRKICFLWFLLRGGQLFLSCYLLSGGWRNLELKLYC